MASSLATATSCRDATVFTNTKGEQDTSPVPEPKEACHPGELTPSLCPFVPSSLCPSRLRRSHCLRHRSIGHRRNRTHRILLVAIRSTGTLQENGFPDLPSVTVNQLNTPSLH